MPKVLVNLHYRRHFDIGHKANISMSLTGNDIDTLCHPFTQKNICYLLHNPEFVYFICNMCKFKIDNNLPLRLRADCKNADKTISEKLHFLLKKMKIF